jgi:hypothetical protein
MSAAFTGPIKVSTNGRYFVDQQAVPFFWLGDTSWPLLMKCTLRQAEAYLDNRSAKGFTVIQCVIAWVDEKDGPLPLPNSAGHRPWLDNNPATPNPDFFQPIDHLVSYAAQRGLVLALLPTWGHFVKTTKSITQANAQAYGRWLGERYRAAPNIIWVNGGDRTPTGFEGVFQALAHGLGEGDQGAHLISYHPVGGRSSSQYFHQESWLDFNMLQTWCDWFRVYPAVMSDALRTPVKPIVHAEGAYENGPEYPTGPITPLIVRRQAWWAFLAGGFHTYGQDQMWRMQPGWDQTFDTPGAAQVGCFKNILTARPWWKLVPDQSLFATGVGSERTLNAAARSEDDQWALVYLSSQCTVRLHLDKIGAREVQATWINPQTGEEQDAGKYLTGNRQGTIFPQGQQQSFTTPPFWEDAVLSLMAV